MLPTNTLMPEDTEKMALTLNGKKTNLRRDDFLVFADKCGIPAKSAKNNGITCHLFGKRGNFPPVPWKHN